MEIVAIIMLFILLLLGINSKILFNSLIFNENEKSLKKLLIWVNTVFVVFTIIIVIVIRVPKKDNDCKVNIIINNKDSFSEINLPDYYYSINKNEIIEIANLTFYGYIAIKTRNEAKIIYYEASDLFNFIHIPHKIKVKINSDRIKITNFGVSLSKFTDDFETYDKLLEIIK
jgi:hypothetical protein